MVCQRWRCTWVNVDAYAALSDLASVLNGSPLGDDASAAGWLEGCSSNDLMVLDGCEHIHAMHAPMIGRQPLVQTRAIVAHRGPRSLESPESMHREVLDPLDDEAAKHILGDVDNAEAILARLGGHLSPSSCTAPG